MYENTKFHIISDETLLEKLITFSNNTKSPFLTFDVETDSEIPRKANLYGIGLCFNTQHAFYIPWRKQGSALWWSESQSKRIIDWMDQLVKDKHLIAHNGIYDVLVMKYNCGVDWTHNLYADTILMKHTVDEERPHGLNASSLKFLGEQAGKNDQKLKEEVVAAGGKYNKTQKDMYLASMETLAEYCCWDVLLTYDLFKVFSKMIKEQELEQLFYIDEIMPLYRWCTIPMKDKGFPVDLELLNKTEAELRRFLEEFEAEVVESLLPHIGNTFEELLDKDAPVTKTGNFPKIVAELNEVPLPIAKKTGKVTMARGGLEKQAEASPEDSWFFDWLLKEDVELDATKAREARLEAFKRKKKQKHLINIKSGDQLGLVLFKGLGIEPKKVSEKTGKPSVNSELIDELLDEKIEKYPFLEKLWAHRKLGKIYSTYIVGTLDRQINGRMFTDFLQHGTTSGRYASRNNNLQNLSGAKEYSEDDTELQKLVKKYTNVVRDVFVAPPGGKIIASDYAQLEPRVFSHVTQDPKLIKAFNSGEDFYSRIAIDVLGESAYSAHPKDTNFLKKKAKPIRNLGKVIALLIPYGGEAGRVSQITGKSYKEADAIIKKYLSEFPGLKNMMKEARDDAIKKGMSITFFGRIRHLQEAKEIYERHGPRILDRKWAKSRGLGLERYKLKNLLNNATNFRIQGMAAHITNRAMIRLAKELIERKLDAYVALNIHDEIVCVANKIEQAEEVAKLLQDCMENTVKISIPLPAEPIIADRLGDAKD